MVVKKITSKNNRRKYSEKIREASIFAKYFTHVQRDYLDVFTLTCILSQSKSMNEHRLYIVLGLLLLVMGALAVRRRDPIGSAAFLIAGAGAVANGVNALRKHIVPQISPQMMRLRLGLLVFGIMAATVLILLEEGLERFGGW